MPSDIIITGLIALLHHVLKIDRAYIISDEVIVRLRACWLLKIDMVIVFQHPNALTHTRDDSKI